MNEKLILTGVVIKDADKTFIEIRSMYYGRTYLTDDLTVKHHQIVIMSDYKVVNQFYSEAGQWIDLDSELFDFSKVVDKNKVRTIFRRI